MKKITMRLTATIDNAINNMNNLTDVWDKIRLYDNIRSLIENDFFSIAFHTPEQWQSYNTEMARFKKAYDNVIETELMVDQELMFQ